MAQPGAVSKDLTLDQVIVKVTNMVSYDSNANKLAKKVGLNINYVSWEGTTQIIRISILPLSTN